MTAAAISAQGLRKSYGDNHVLTGIDIEINPGEVVVLLGPNGAGKTTTLEILEGFLAPSGGEVRVLGVDPLQGDEAWRSRVGVVLQTWRDHPRWRVREMLSHIAEFYRAYSTPEREKPWDVDELLTQVGISDLAGRQLMKLSGGERRRLDLALGLVGQPDLLFLDEPTAGLDPQARREFHDLLRTVADRKTTILLTTHDLAEAEELADRILVLVGGQIVADDSPDALRRRVGSTTEIRWARDGVTHVTSTEQPAEQLKSILAEPGGPFTDLEVRRATLEQAYLNLVNAAGTAASPLVSSGGRS